MDYWTPIGHSADLALIYGVRQRADMLAAQRSLLAIEQERLALDRNRQEAEAEDRRVRQEAAEKLTAARKLLCQLEQNLGILEQDFDPHRSEDIVMLAIIGENSRQLETVFSELTDLRALTDLTSRSNKLVNALIRQRAIDTSPSEILKSVLPTLESILKGVRESVVKRLFVHPKYQSEVKKLQAMFAKRRQQSAQSLNFADILRYYEGVQHEEARLRFNSLSSQLDPSECGCDVSEHYTRRKTLLEQREGDQIDPNELHEKLEVIDSLSKSFEEELDLLAAKIPHLCLSTITGIPNKNVSFFAYTCDPDQTRYPNAQTLEWYDLVARTGQGYLDICAELSEIHSYLNGLLQEYTYQWQQLEQVDAFLQAGDYHGARNLLDGIRKLFTAIPYTEYDEALEKPFKLLKQAEDLEARLKKSQNSIFTSRKTKERFWQEFYVLSRTAETLPDCEVRSQLVHKLTSVQELGGYSL